MGTELNIVLYIKISFNFKVLDTVDTKIADSEIATFLNPPVQEIAAVKQNKKDRECPL